MRQRPRSPIPRKAKEIPKYQDGKKYSADYYLDGERVGSRDWYPNGKIETEWGFRDGRNHGPARVWHENGQLRWETRFKDGYENGLSRQWNANGELIGTYRMKMGTGVDLWWSRSDKYPDEERHMLRGARHGFERWWEKKNKVWIESHFQNGLDHGVFRSWGPGRLDRGYPKFYILGKKVTKREYLKAAKSDATLPAYDPKDDSPRRKPLSLPLDGAGGLVGQIVKDAAHSRHTK